MIIEKHFTWPGGGQYYSLGVNVLGGIYRISLNNSPGVYFLQRILIPGYKTRQASI